MVTEYDKAIAGFIVAAIQLLVAFKLPLPGVSVEALLSIVPFVTGIVVWLVPNKPPAASVRAEPPNVGNPTPGASR